MPVPPLPYELWSRIAGLVQNPKPAPLSCPPRSQLRQPHLAVLSRVSKMFQSICEPLLYTHIVHDELAHLLNNVDFPSMRRKFAMTKSLSIEYMARGQDPSYSVLCNVGGPVWGLYGRTHRDVQAGIVAECEQEADNTHSSLKMANDYGGAKALFPNLKTVAVSSVYGRETDAWKRHAGARETGQGVGDSYQHCSLMFERFLAKSSVRHLCVRDPAGPLTILTISPSFHPHFVPVKYTQTIHLPAEIDSFGITFGAPLRITCDAPSSADFAVLLSKILYEICRIMKQRTFIVRGRPFRDPLDIEVFCSAANLTPYTLTQALGYVRLDGLGFENVLSDWDMFDKSYHKITQKEAKGLAERMRQSLVAMFRLYSKVDDNIRWSTSDLTPICAACGSGPPS